MDIRPSPPLAISTIPRDIALIVDATMEPTMFTTRLKKSGRKKVYDQNTEGWRGNLNEAARAPFRGQAGSLTAGFAGLSNPLKARKAPRVPLVTQIRRRRKLASRHKVG